MAQYKNKHTKVYDELKIEQVTLKIFSIKPIIQKLHIFLTPIDRKKLQRFLYIQKQNNNKTEMKTKSLLTNQSLGLILKTSAYIQPHSN